MENIQLSLFGRMYPELFSSNNGEDFRAVLEKVTNANIPMPASGKWATAGMVRGGEVDTAWRVLDAQYWGVPQRRKTNLPYRRFWRTTCRRNII